jgi:hypothetical protein
MKWFDKWFAKKCKQARDGELVPAERDSGLNIVGSKQKANRGLVASSPVSSELDSRGVSFTLYNANGGHVIELRHYDEKQDRMKNSLHVVPHDKDLGEAINHIITYEALKR